MDTTVKNISQAKSDLLLQIASLLMTSGANTNRVLLILNKFSKLIKTDAELFIDHKVFILSTKDSKEQPLLTQVKRLPKHTVNFDTISGLSRISYIAEKEEWTFDKIKDEVQNLTKVKVYSQWFKLLSVSLGGAGLCYIFDGDMISMLVTFVATFFGFFTKQYFDRHNFNPYLSAFFGALIAALLAASFYLVLPDFNPNIAVATAVLFIVPGVPLVNSFTDVMDGYYISGFVRFIHGLLYVFAIAFALFIVMYLFNIQNI